MRNDVRRIDIGLCVFVPGAARRGHDVQSPTVEEANFGLVVAKFYPSLCGKFDTSEHTDATLMSVTKRTCDRISSHMFRSSITQKGQPAPPPKKRRLDHHHNLSLSLPSRVLLPSPPSSCVVLLSHPSLVWCRSPPPGGSAFASSFVGVVPVAPLGCCCLLLPPFGCCCFLLSPCGITFLDGSCLFLCCWLWKNNLWCRS